MTKGDDFEPTCMHRSNQENMLVYGDSNGNLKVNRFPCISKDIPPVKAVGHVKDVSKVRFTCDGKYAISVGKHDRSIIVWKILSEDGKSGVAAIEDANSTSDATSKKSASTKKSSKAGVKGDRK